MTYPEVVDRLAVATEKRVGALWARYQSGDLTRAQLEAALTVALLQSEAAGTSLGDAGLAAALTASSARIVAPVGIGMDEGRPAAIGKAVRTLLGRLDDLDEDLPDRDELASLRAQRLGRSVAMGAPQNGWAGALKGRGVSGWVRQTTGKSCGICVAMADGKTHSATSSMWRHNGCDCIQSPA